MPVLISSVFLFFSVVNGFQIGALQGLEGFNSLARASIASGAAAVVIAPAAGYLWGVTGAVAGLAVAGAIRWVLLHFSLAGELRKAGIVLCRRGLRREFDTLFRFALPAALAGFSIGPAAWICNTILVRVPKGFSQAAVYSASLSMLTILLFLPQVVDRVVMVLLNHQKGLNDGSSYRKVFFTNVGVISAVTVGGAACLALAGPYLLRLFGKSFASDGYPVLVILLLAGIPEALTLAVSQILISKERFWLFTLGAVLPRDCALVGGAMILTPRYGALGLAAAYAVARLAGLLLSLAFALRTGLSLDGGKSSPA
jgi:O-antigen/teichoic acid export membrane protein